MSGVYIHSSKADFAQTQVLSEGAYLGRRLRKGGLRLLRCGCARGDLVRIYRHWWMRLLPLFRQYRCLRCGARVLRWRMRQQRVYYSRC